MLLRRFGLVDEDGPKEKGADDEDAEDAQERRPAADHHKDQKGFFAENKAKAAAPERVTLSDGTVRACRLRPARGGGGGGGAS